MNDVSRRRVRVVSSDGVGFLAAVSVRVGYGDMVDDIRDEESMSDL